jgi:hypothetical protein
MVTLRKNKGSALTYDEMDQNQVEAAHRVAASSISEDLSLSGKQSSILVGDDITIASGKTVTLRDSASIDIIKTADLISLTQGNPLYRPGATIQTQFKQITTATDHRFLCSADQGRPVSTNSETYGTYPWGASAPYFCVGQNGGARFFGINIRPSHVNSVIKLEAQVCGEWNVASTSQDSMWGFARQINRGSYTFLGNTSDPFTVRNNGVMPNFTSQDGTDVDSTMESSIFTFFDFPNTVELVTYHVVVASGNSREFRLNRTWSNSESINYERGTSFICGTEIAQ